MRLDALCKILEGREVKFKRGSPSVECGLNRRAGSVEHVLIRIQRHHIEARLEKRNDLLSWATANVQRSPRRDRLSVRDPHQ